MGVTKQAAQKRFVLRTDPNQRFERFTRRARNAVVAAQNAAHEAGNDEITPDHDEITPDHLVLGTLSDVDALAIKTAHGAAGRPRIGTCLDHAPPAVDEPPQLIPFSGPARKALELTIREALRLGHNYIGTEHLLLALLEREDGTGPLHRAGIDKGRVENDLTAVLESLATGKKD